MQLRSRVVFDAPACRYSHLARVEQATKTSTCVGHTRAWVIPRRAQNTHSTVTDCVARWRNAPVFPRFASLYDIPTGVSGAKHS